jgi:hypothetical protein
MIPIRIAKNKNMNKPRKLILVILAVVITLAVIGSGLWYWRANSSSVSTDKTKPINTVNYTPSTQQEQQDGINQKKTTIEKNESQNPQADSLSVNIAHAEQLGQNMSVRTFVSGTTTGTCQVEFTQDSQPTISKTFNIAADATSSICNGDIPISEFGAGGKWLLKISATNGSSTSATVSQDVIVNK